MWLFLLGTAPTAKQRPVSVVSSAPRKRRRNVGVTNARRARQETGRRMPEYSKSWPRDPAGQHQMHPSLYTIAPMARPITYNNALRLSLSPITRAPRSLTPPSLAAATRRLVVPNALLETVPKGTRRQGGSGRRSARLAMLLRSCGWSGRGKRPGGWEEAHARAQNTAGQGPCVVSNSKHSQQTGPCATLVGAEMRAGIHTDRSSRGEGAGTRNPAVEALFAAGRWRCFVNGCGVLWSWPCRAPALRPRR